MTNPEGRNRNPYIIGRPIDEPEQLFGRQSLFGFIEDNLRQNVKFILLHGQRRIGKSSVLKMIHHFVAKDEFFFVHFNLEDKSQSKLNEILAELATAIVEQLNIDTIQPPDSGELENKPLLYFSKFLSEVYQSLHGKNLVLLLDEFDVASQETFSIVEQGLGFFSYLEKLLRQEEKLFIIPVVGRHVGDIPNLVNLFGSPPNQKIGLLDETSAKRLITNPAKGVLNYEADAINAIQELSAGHPYFTQVICDSLFKEARITNNWTVTRANVEAIIDKAIESGEGGLAWFWDGLPIPEQVVISAVAEAQNIAIKKNQDFPEDSLTILGNYGISLTDDLREAAKSLEKKGFLDDTKRRVKIELVRRWLVQRHPLPQKSEYSNKYKRKGFLIGTIAAAVIVPLLGFGVYQFSTPCPAGKNKEFGILCVQDTSKISRGERTFFPTTGNTNRDLGIDAFKKHNYSQAAQFFKQAVADNRNDPEVLIYYNNALARKQGSRLTIAAVVPADNKANLAKEMLRGIAQSQNQFNQKGGLNGKLLEVIIANDANEQEQAKQIAQELVKDKSIMGVIGHNSGEATNAALAEYKLANLAIISPTSTSISLQGDNFFRTVPSDHPAGKKLAEYASQTLKLKKVVIFANPESTYSDSMREVFTKYFEKLGGEVVRPPLINLADSALDVDKEILKSVGIYQAEGAAFFPDTEHTDVALKIIKYNADLIASPQNTQKKGLKLLGGNSLYNKETLDLEGKAAEGLILAVPWFKNSPQSKNFSQAAAQQWGGEVSWRTATSYDATQALIKALSNNPTRATVLQQLKEVNLPKEETSGEPLSFGSGERKTQPILVKIKNGQFELVQ
ncbi:ABC transporter substrate-binding protein [Limnofasciculus baicalensis]|uniref:ABC transporter substrate-binding protein n=1 Tax=Limnofasciculus baicalensis BBK-W-15 TaxID=2699891 RepID=A0AAE3GTN3_9CYAN|nr:ABC transporter substrate-binding protein [Limnofasciculus baicalensis]MCP2730520.1 ABC transporter substrate-binding protein [Limnofasciculus baicalensis BBK-W-15]